MYAFVKRPRSYSRQVNSNVISLSLTLNFVPENLHHLQIFAVKVLLYTHTHILLDASCKNIVEWWSSSNFTCGTIVHSTLKKLVKNKVIKNINDIIMLVVWLLMVNGNPRFIFLSALYLQINKKEKLGYLLTFFIYIWRLPQFIIFWVLRALSCMYQYMYVFMMRDWDAQKSDNEMIHPSFASCRHYWGRNFWSIRHLMYSFALVVSVFEWRLLLDGPWERERQWLQNFKILSPT